MRGKISEFSDDILQSSWPEAQIQYIYPTQEATIYVVCRQARPRDRWMGRPIHDRYPESHVVSRSQSVRIGYSFYTDEVVGYRTITGLNRGCNLKRESSLLRASGYLNPHLVSNLVSQRQNPITPLGFRASRYSWWALIRWSRVWAKSRLWHSSCHLHICLIVDTERPLSTPITYSRLWPLEVETI